MWVVHWCWEDEVDEVIDAGWEPFAVTVNPWDRAPKVWLRRQKS